MRHTMSQAQNQNHKLYIVMVGLPAMGKSTVAAKLEESFRHGGIKVKIFNNGDLRRKMLGAHTSEPDFYAPENTEGMSQREMVARLNIRNARKFLAAKGQVAILDATNVSRERRRTVRRMLNNHPILFLECLNEDEEMLDASISRKTRLPEFSRLTFEEAYQSFTERIAYYRRIYTPLYEEENFIVLDSLNNRIFRERISKDIPHYIRIRDLLVSDWVKNLSLIRHGVSQFNLQNRIGGDSDLAPEGKKQARALAEHFKNLHLPFVFTSTLKRTIQTAKPILERHPDATLISLPEFDEIDAGECENMSYEEIRRIHPEIFLARSRDKYNYVYPSGEGYATLKDRVDRGVKKALYLSGNADNIMIVGHQAVNRMILSHFLFRRTEDVPYIFIPQDRYFHIVSTQRKKLFQLKSY